MYNVSWMITSWFSNPAIKHILGMTWSWITTQSDYLGWMVWMVNQWVWWVGRFFQVPWWVFIGVLLIILIGSVFIQHNSKA